MSERLKTTGNVGVALLRAIHASADAFGPLKGATGGALHIIDQVSVRAFRHRLKMLTFTRRKTFHSNKAHWIEFGEYTADAVALIAHKMGTDPSKTDDQKDSAENVEKLKLLVLSTSLSFVRDPFLITAIEVSSTISRAK